MSWSAFDRSISTTPRARRVGFQMGERGLALVDFESIAGQPLWVNNQAKQPHRQHFAEDDTLPQTTSLTGRVGHLLQLSLTFFRRTGQSYFAYDWKDFHKDYITWKEADNVKQYTGEYVDRTIRKGH